MSTLKLDPSGDTEKTEKTSAKKGRPASSTVKQRAESELRTRFEAAFIKLADMLEKRGDEELSEAIREERGPMTSGIISITAPFVPLRQFFLVLLSAAELLLAFGRVGGILLTRYAERRERRMQERAVAQAEYEAAQNSAYVVP